VRIRLLPQPGEPALRAGVTATVSIDTQRQRRFGDAVAWVTGVFSGRASAAGGDALREASR
jgi:hypothetical protein